MVLPKPRVSCPYLWFRMITTQNLRFFHGPMVFHGSRCLGYIYNYIQHCNWHLMCMRTKKHHGPETNGTCATRADDHCVIGVVEDFIASNPKSNISDVNMFVCCLVLVPVIVLLCFAKTCSCSKVLQSFCVLLTLRTLWLSRPAPQARAAGDSKRDSMASIRLRAQNGRKLQMCWDVPRKLLEHPARFWRPMMMWLNRKFATRLFKDACDLPVTSWSPWSRTQCDPQSGADEASATEWPCRNEHLIKLCSPLPLPSLPVGYKPQWTMDQCKRLTGFEHDPQRGKVREIHSNSMCSKWSSSPCKHGDERTWQWKTHQQYFLFNATDSKLQFDSKYIYT